MRKIAALAVAFTFVLATPALAHNPSFGDANAVVRADRQARYGYSMTSYTGWDQGAVGDHSRRVRFEAWRLLGAQWYVCRGTARVQHTSIAQWYDSPDCWKVATA